MSGGIDWPAVKERVRRSELALQAAFESQGLDLGAVLASRAQKLATRESVANRTSTVEVLTFRLAGYRYGWPLTELAGVRRLDRWTPLPDSSEVLLGVVCHRGEILPLLSLKHMLLEQAIRQQSCGYAVILRELGVVCLVDEFEGLVELDCDRIRKLEQHDSLLLGIAPDDLRVLSLEKFSQHSYFQNQEDRS